MKQDVIHTEDFLVINIRENDSRGLKIEKSKRSLPIVSEIATQALQKLLEAKNDSPYLFPRYAPCGCILLEPEKTKRRTMKLKRLQHAKSAA